METVWRLGYAGVEKPLREAPGEPCKARALSHRGRERGDALIPLRLAAERRADGGGKALSALFYGAGDRVEGADAVVFLRVRLREGAAAALLGYHMQQHGHAHVPRPGDGALERGDVVPVDGAEVVEAEVVEHVLGQNRALDSLLDPVGDVVHRLHLADGAAVPALEGEVAWLDAHAAEQPGHAADVGAYAHGVVVEDDHQRLPALPGVGEALVGEAAGERAVADDSDYVVVPPEAGPRAGHAQGHGDAVGGVARDEGVRLALRGLREARDAAVFAQLFKALPPPGQQLVRIALVAHVKDYAVAIRVVNPVERHGELHGAEVRGKVAAGLGKALYQECADLRTQLRELLLRQGAELRYIVYVLKYGQGLYLL